MRRRRGPAAAAPRADLLPALARGAVALALALALLGSYAERWGLSGAAGGTGAGRARVGDPAPAFQARTLEGRGGLARRVPRPASRS
ncbi:MAG: hypothetical protein KatS3mg060_2310 [Dehalococcoidia bacterium]|nr:MAG: hypothetical protein KatS3mg060_2310 [Dehalococcoidia bacterium]